MASRESLIESHIDECESDDTILMSQVSESLIEHTPINIKIIHNFYIN